MADITLFLAAGLAQEISYRAETLGSAAEEWVAAMLSDITADLPEGPGGGGDDWISRCNIRASLNNCLQGWVLAPNRRVPCPYSRFCPLPSFSLR
jgi:hypothetical protein